MEMYSVDGDEFSVWRCTLQPAMHGDRLLGTEKGSPDRITWSSAGPVGRFWSRGDTRLHLEQTVFPDVVPEVDPLATFPYLEKLTRECLQ